MPKVYSIDGIVPVVHPTAFVHDSAVLIGDVIVGAHAYIGPCACLRGDFGRIVVEEGANIQDTCMLHGFPGRDTVVGTEATIGHGAVLHGCTVRRGALVGMNAVVNDNAEVGEEVYGPNFSELWVSLGEYRGNYQAARRQIEEVMARHPGFEHDLLTYLQERIKEVLTGTGATVVLRIYGPELPGLREQAQRIKSAIEGAPGKVEGVVDLKVGEFLPENVGKMQFYLAALDDVVREDGENPAIGIILCKSKDKTIVEYALRGSSKPIGFATYRIVPALPVDLEDELPTPDQITRLLEGM